MLRNCTKLTSVRKMSLDDSSAGDPVDAVKFMGLSMDDWENMSTADRDDTCIRTYIRMSNRIFSELVDVIASLDKDIRTLNARVNDLKRRLDEHLQSEVD